MGSQWPNFERGRLVHRPNSPASIIFDRYRGLNEASIWVELDAKKRSAAYHISKYLEVQYRNEETEEAALGRNQASFNQHDGRLIHGGGDISKSVWRLKVESDMAASNLLAIRRIIDLLETSTDYATDITGGLGAVILWSTMLTGAYMYWVRNTYYIPFLDAGALAMACGAGFGTVASVCRLGYAGMRALVLHFCRGIVDSLHDRIQAGTVSRHDLESLQCYWFRGLDLFRVKDDLDGDGEYGVVYQAVTP